jgi:glycosyltransferase involved in cell wall biosynthesis
MQTYERLKNRFDITAFVPHETYMDVSAIQINKESLWCPIAGKTPFEREKRKWQALRDAATGQTHSFCGLGDRLKGFDLYHVMDQYFCFSYEAVLAKRKYGGKLLVSQWENIPYHNEEKFMERHIKHSVREQADLFLAMSELSKRALLEEGVPEGKIEKISSGVDVTHFSPGKADEKLRQSLGLPPKAFAVLYVGRLSESKGIFTLLEAARTLRSAKENIHFLLVGKDEEGVGKWVADNGLSDRVHLAGFVPYDRMPKYYRLSGMLVLPSLKEKRQQEQFGYVLAEAMACGVPVLGSDCGAIPEVIGDARRIFKSGSADKLAQLIMEWKRKPQAPQRLEARKRSQSHYSSSNLSQNLARIYQGLLATPS